MIIEILLSLLAVFAIYLSLLVIKPLAELILLKIKHGNDIHISFMPIVGQIFRNKKALKIYNDAEYYKRETIKNHPEAKVNK